MREDYDVIVVGAGLAGCVVASKLATAHFCRVLVLESRNHIGGNCYDKIDDNGILVHEYGPHIFHTNHKHVYDYLSQYTKLTPYIHKVVANVNGGYLPVPFNLDSLAIIGKGQLEADLIKAYGHGSSVPILTLKENPDLEIKALADDIYDLVFSKYTAKQWGMTPEQIDKSVTARVPIRLDRAGTYFKDTYQAMPDAGYTAMFAQMLDHPNITVKLNTEFDLVKIPNDKPVVYTGAIDALFDFKHGRLPYRSIDFVFEQYQKKFYQDHAVVNYTVSEDFTRITEFKHLTGQSCPQTTILKEFPTAYEGKPGQIPSYPVENAESKALYQQYLQEVEKFDNLYLVGRLAEYKYFNMDEVVANALKLCEDIKFNCSEL